MLVLPVGTVVGAPAARLARRQSATSGSTATMWQSGRERPKSTRRHIHVPPWTDCVEVHWSSGGEAYVTPVDDYCVGIAILSSQHGGFDAHFHEFPALPGIAYWVVNTAPTELRAHCDKGSRAALPGESYTSVTRRVTRTH